MHSGLERENSGIIVNTTAQRAATVRFKNTQYNYDSLHSSNGALPCCSSLSSGSNMFRKTQIW